jgi:hypothetical protein
MFEMNWYILRRLISWNWYKKCLAVVSAKIAGPPHFLEHCRGCCVTAFAFCLSYSRHWAAYASEIYCTLSTVFIFVLYYISH